MPMKRFCHKCALLRRTGSYSTFRNQNTRSLHLAVNLSAPRRNLQEGDANHPARVLSQAVKSDDEASVGPKVGNDNATLTAGRAAHNEDPPKDGHLSDTNIRRRRRSNSCLSDPSSESNAPSSSQSTRNISTLKTSLSTINSSPHHNSLSTFLAYAASTNLSQTSPVYKGTYYEYTAIESLRRLNFSLTRTARSGDNGIDLVGHWTVPCSPTPLRVLAQCKARASSVASPEQVRELEGAFIGAPAGWRGEGVLGLLIATGRASKGVLEALGRSRWPLGFLKVSGEGRVGQFVWNRAAEGVGLQGLGVTMKFSESAKGVGVVLVEGAGGANSCVTEEVVLTWEGKLVKALPNGGAGVKPKKRGRPRNMELHSE